MKKIMVLHHMCEGEEFIRELLAGCEDIEVVSLDEGPTFLQPEARIAGHQPVHVVQLPLHSVSPFIAVGPNFFIFDLVKSSLPALS